MVLQVVLLEERKIRNSHDNVAQHAQGSVQLRFAGPEGDAVRYLVNGQGHRVVHYASETIGYRQDGEIAAVA